MRSRDYFFLFFFFLFFFSSRHRHLLPTRDHVAISRGRASRRVALIRCPRVIYLLYLPKTDRTFGRRSVNPRMIGVKLLLSRTFGSDVHLASKHQMIRFTGTFIPNSLLLFIASSRRITKAAPKPGRSSASPRIPFFLFPLLFVPSQPGPNHAGQSGLDCGLRGNESRGRSSPRHSTPNSLATLRNCSLSPFFFYTFAIEYHATVDVVASVLYICICKENESASVLRTPDEKRQL